jgi:segregation and condensation protein B
LFAAGEPIEKKRIAVLLGISSADLGIVLAALDTALANRGLALIETAETLELRTAPAAADVVRKLYEAERARDLGKASLETLAVIAYQDGGATRSEIDWVRGVNSSASVRTLLLRGLVEGREDEADKRRIRYALTSEALAHLGLSSLAELPRKAELARGAAEALATAGEDAP